MTSLMDLSEAWRIQPNADRSVGYELESHFGRLVNYPHKLTWSLHRALEWGMNFELATNSVTLSLRPPVSSGTQTMPSIS